jgi:hypothetical protein
MIRDDTSTNFDKAGEDILGCKISDEALEAAGGARLSYTYTPYGGYGSCCGGHMMPHGLAQMRIAL